jgi:sterol desaturase/sphingolipid hydroxylase (fatty acid hydroxylase superfamily)
LWIRLLELGASSTSLARIYFLALFSELLTPALATLRPCHPTQFSIASMCIALPALFIVYDFFYAPFHRALHHRSVYAYVHKHHHRQVVPTRGNNDAINVHPFEFILGEYNHVLAVYLVSRFVVPIHAITCVLFLVFGGCLATLNHTRLDVSFLRIPFTGGVPIFGVRAHDTHHAIPNSNYGQYIMLWDWVMGTYRAHPLDPGSIESQRAAADGDDTNTALRVKGE